MLGTMFARMVPAENGESSDVGQVESICEYPTDPTKIGSNDKVKGNREKA